MDTIPQNIKHLLQDIGENSVLLRLYLELYNSGWNAYRNLHEAGCDIIILPKVVGSFSIQSFRFLKIEVKTRQKVIYKGKDKSVHFTATQSEYNNCHFLIAYWFDENEYFIIPKNYLNKQKSGNKHVYKFIVSKKMIEDKKNDIQKFRNNWKLITKATIMTWNDGAGIENLKIED
ncbi:MAG: hypothetical protein U0U67_13925 [Chitinophagales bacterium]